MFLIQRLTIFLPLLTSILAYAQSPSDTTTTYPECCAALRTEGLSVCDFDFLGTADATTSQTACVCSIDGIDTPLNQCITCMRANPQLATYADGYAAICKNYQTTTATTSTTVTALGDNSISTTITNSTTTSAPTRATTTRTSTTTAIATTTTHVSVASAVDNGNGVVGGNTPNIVLAALALLVQAGL